MQILLSHLREDPPLVSDFNPDMPEDVDRGEHFLAGANHVLGKVDLDPRQAADVFETEVAGPRQQFVA